MKLGIGIGLGYPIIGKGEPPPPVDPLTALLEVLDPIAIYESETNISAGSTAFSWSEARGTVGVPPIEANGMAPPQLQEGMVYLPPGIDTNVATEQSTLFAVSAAAPKWFAIVAAAESSAAAWLARLVSGGSDHVSVYVDGSYGLDVTLDGVNDWELSSVADGVETLRLFIVRATPAEPIGLRVPNVYDFTGAEPSPSDEWLTGAIELGEQSVGLEAMIRMVAVCNGVAPTPEELSALIVYAVAEGASVT